jgi:microcystin-dependent protein
VNVLKLLTLLLALVAGSAAAATWERPAGAYTPSNHSVNITKYQTDSANHVAISSAKVDGDINKAFQALNDIEGRTPPSVSGNGGKFLTNDGSAASWSYITSATIRSVSATSGQALTADGAGSTTWSTLALVPVGVTLPFAGLSSTVPSGWIIEAGQSVSRTGVYANLFAVIGTTYGSNDGNSFSLPDLRGRVIAGLDNMGGVAAGRVSLTTSGISGTILGAAGGDQRMQAHTHTATVTDPGHFHNMQGSGSGSSGATTAQQNPGTGSDSKPTSVALTGIGVSNSIAGLGNSENMQPTMMMNWIIKY